MSKLAEIVLKLDPLTDQLIKARDDAKRDAKPPTKLTVAGAAVLASAEVLTKRLKSAAKIAEEIQKLTRARYRDLIPLSEDEEEREQGIRVAELGRFRLRVTPVAGGERFSLTEYRKAGHTVTPEMETAISNGNRYDRWTISDAKGPRRADAVEPSDAAASSTLF